MLRCLCLKPFEISFLRFQGFIDGWAAAVVDLSRILLMFLLCRKPSLVVWRRLPVFSFWWVEHVLDHHEVVLCLGWNDNVGCFLASNLQPQLAVEGVGLPQLLSREQVSAN